MINMNRTLILKGLLTTIHGGLSIPIDMMKEVATLTGNREIDSILKLQTLIYNMALKKHFPSPEGNIFIFGELIECVAAFVEMPQPAKKLAYLDRLSFIQYCEDNRQYGQIASKAIGIYPRLQVDENLPKIMNYEAAVVSMEDEVGRIKYIGNPNWQLTRSIFAQWQDCMKDTLSAEQNLSCHILLSTDSLFSLCSNTSWNALWSRLYVWYMHQLLSTNLNPSIKFKNWHFISEVDKHTKDIQDICMDLSQRTPNQRIIVKLIISVIKEFVCYDKEDFHFKDAFQIFSNVDGTGFGQLWQYLLINELFFKLAQILELQIVAENSRGLMETFRRQLDQDNLAQQLKYFLPQLFTQEELIAYIRERQIAYWQYGLNDQMIKNISLKELHEGPFNQDNAKYVLKHLNYKDFVSKVLSQDYSLWEGRTEKSMAEKKKLRLIVKTVGQNADELGNTFYEYLNDTQEEIVKGLKAFGQQWTCVQQVQEDGVREDTLNSVLQFIGFDFKLSSKFKNQCKLPIEENELIWQIIDRLIDFINSSFERLLPETMTKIKEIFYTKEFYLTLERLPSLRKDKFWQRFSWILLKDSSFVKTLLAIKPTKKLIDPCASIPSQSGNQKEVDIVTS